MINLEPLAAAAAERMTAADPGAALNLINKAVMVLAEQGLFAFGLFLATRKREADVRAAEDIHRGLSSLLEQARLHPPEIKAQPLQAGYYKALTGTWANEAPLAALQRILLTKQVLEVALTYGRYHAKAG
jgi:hypothetical protein